MSTERQSPDAILELVNLTGVVSAIQDDPDSPDGSWLVASGNNVNTAVRVSVPTPTGNPTVGADLQELRVLFRQYDEGQGGTPEGRIELWENGVLIRAGSDVDIPDGGLVVSFRWNANELGTPDGSLVEIKAVGTKVGGSPSNRNSVEVGAVEWNVEYTAGGEEHSGSGSISGNGSLAGTPKKGGKGSALTSAGGTLLAIGLAGMLAVASIAGGGTQVSVGKKAVAGDASVSGNGAQAVVGKKSAPGTLTISGGGSLTATGQSSEVEEHSGSVVISGGGTIEVTAKACKFIPDLEEYCIDLDICRGKEFDLIICREKKISLNVKREFLEELEI